ncbi:TOBE domain-containing protein, partial [Proteus mirabilis]|uniref:TOBE domain-containing protein n=1 Tax=Proteus mirabilis TaxID=584 RepID=UPI002576E101
NVMVVEHHSHYAMTATAFGNQVLWLPQIEAKIGRDVRGRIDASDVSLTTTRPSNSSIRNILHMKVVEMIKHDDQVDVKLVNDGNYLWARINPWARDELNIQEG